MGSGIPSQWADTSLGRGKWSRTGLSSSPEQITISLLISAVVNRVPVNHLWTALRPVVRTDENDPVPALKRILPALLPPKTDTRTSLKSNIPVTGTEVRRAWPSQVSTRPWVRKFTLFPATVLVSVPPAPRSIRLPGSGRILPEESMTTLSSSAQKPSPCPCRGSSDTPDVMGPMDAETMGDSTSWSPRGAGRSPAAALASWMPPLATAPS